MIKPICTGFTAEQEAKIQEAVKRWDFVWCTEDFKRRVLQARFTQTSDSSAVIYEKITAGIKTSGIVVKYVLNPVKNGSETAATDTVSGVTTIQSWYIESSDLNSLVNTLSHESTHRPTQGAYTHSKFYNRFVPYLKLRPWSVSYQVGDITEKLSLANFGK
jgi:hypothetical protein